MLSVIFLLSHWKRVTSKQALYQKEYCYWFASLMHSLSIGKRAKLPDFLKDTHLLFPVLWIICKKHYFLHAFVLPYRLKIRLRKYKVQKLNSCENDFDWLEVDTFYSSSFKSFDFWASQLKLHRVCCKICPFKMPLFNKNISVGDANFRARSEIFEFQRKISKSL